ALIRLKTSFEFMNNPYIQPSLLLAKECGKIDSGGKCIQSLTDWANKVNCVTAGWGLTPNSGLTKTGKDVEVWINTDSPNKKESVIKTESKGNTLPICEGFSGSPLMCTINTTGMHFIPPQHMVVLGVNSVKEPEGCLNSEVAKFTQTSLFYYMEWISQNVIGWSQWGGWSKCSKSTQKRFRLRSGFFPEYGYLPSDGPLYQSYSGDQLQVEETNCEIIVKTTTKLTTPTTKESTTKESTTKESTTKTTKELTTKTTKESTSPTTKTPTSSPTEQVSCKDVAKGSEHKDMELKNIVNGTTQKAYLKNKLAGKINSEAKNAIDGHTDGIHRKNAQHPCAHSLSKTNEPWWLVDLGRSYHISGVKLWNRRDCCGERLRNFEIMVTNELIGDKTDRQKDSEWKQCTKVSGILNTASEVLCCQTPMQGRYLKLQMLGEKETLTLCEIEIFGGTDSSVDCLCYLKNN
ncbi:unnamed protein product, partial [Owenia fusiformis]